MAGRSDVFPHHVAGPAGSAFMERRDPSSSFDLNLWHAMLHESCFRPYGDHLMNSGIVVMKRNALRYDFSKLFLAA